MNRIIKNCIWTVLLVVFTGCADDQGNNQPAEDDTDSEKESITETDSQTPLDASTGNTSDNSSDLDTGLTTDSTISDDTSKTDDTSTASQHENDSGTNTDETATDSEGPTTADGDTETETETETETVKEIEKDTDRDTDTAIEPDVYDTDPTHVSLSPPCDLSKRIGKFKVMEITDNVMAYTAISGKVNNGVTPVEVLDLHSSEGECKLLQKRKLECDPMCTSNTSCDEHGECIPTPVGQDLGVAVIQGLVKSVQMNPTVVGNIYSFYQLPHIAWDPGVVIHLTTTPGYLGSLKLNGIGVELLTPKSDTLTFKDGEPVTLLWESAEADAKSTVRLTVDVNLHAVGTPMILECEFADDGEGVVPATLISAFIDAGVSGFPEAFLLRRTIDSASSQKGCVEFEVGSRRKQELTVDGYVPCNDDDACPTNFTCNEMIQTCVPK